MNGTVLVAYGEWVDDIVKYDLFALPGGLTSKYRISGILEVGIHKERLCKHKSSVKKTYLLYTKVKTLNDSNGIHYGGI